MSTMVSIQPIGDCAKWFALDAEQLLSSEILYFGAIYFAFKSPHTKACASSIHNFKLIEGMRL